MRRDSVSQQRHGWGGQGDSFAICPHLAVMVNKTHAGSFPGRADNLANEELELKHLGSYQTLPIAKPGLSSVIEPLVPRGPAMMIQAPLSSPLAPA